MKVLSLYIDKWYMVGSVIDGAISTPLSLSNGEERIWLYFWSNSTVNNVNYGQRYKDEALDGKTGYYTDIFDLLPDYKEYSYEKYGEKKSIKKIFDDAGILSDLKKSFGADYDIPVYLSFSDDIDIVSQHIFINLLSENNFIVKQYTESIDSLTVDFLERKGCISHTQYVLVVNACNENLIYSICIKEKKRVRIIASRKINGYGIDCREQAIVEEVLEYLQDATRFLTNDPREKREELLYLSQYAQGWLRKLDEAPVYAPVTLGNVHFKKQSGNDVPVTISPQRVNDRTKNIIEKLVVKAVDLLTDRNILLSQISHIIFLGDIFKNKNFGDFLKLKIGVDERNIINIPELDLADIVGVYDVWKPDDFKEEQDRQKKSALNKYKQDEHNAVESKTIRLKELAACAENEDRIQDAIDLFDRILSIDATDKFSQSKKANLVKELKRREDDRIKIQELLLKANHSFGTGKYDDAVRFCNETLRIHRNNLEAKFIREKALDFVRRQQQLEKYIQKMNEFISSEEFYKAKDTLQKVDDNNFNDARLKDIRDQIESGIIQFEQTINNLKTKFEDAYSLKDYFTCIEVCGELISLGVDEGEWSNKKNQILKQKQQDEEFEDNRTLARQARLNGKWQKVLEYTRKALSIRYDLDMTELELEAQDEIQKSYADRIQNEFLEAAADENWEKVITLYDENTFLKSKSSNSTWYRKAKLCAKSKSNRVKCSEPRSVASLNTRKESDVSTEVRSAMAKKDHKKKTKVGPSRPCLATRPRVNPHDSNTIGIPTQPPTNESFQKLKQYDSENKVPEMMATHKKSHDKNKKVINKPKR